MSTVSFRVLALSATALVLGCSKEAPPEPSPDPVPVVTTPQSPTTCPLATVAVTSVVPFDTSVDDQASINCFAWQQFIALNWPAAAGGAGIPAPVPASDFGKPGDDSPVVWETYMNSHQLMNEDGSEPPPWGTSPEVPAACTALNSDRTRRALAHTSKFTSDFETPDDLLEAVPNSAPNWIADRNGNPVFFEIMLSEEEYNYVRSDQRRLYNSDDQVAYVEAGNHINLPRGEAGVSLGSLEFKASWLQINDPDDPKWRKYKLSHAYASDGEEFCEEITVALVALHIIHKTLSNPQWIWTTFEHVDNSPTQAEVNRGQVEDRYTFFDPACEPQPINQSCLTQATAGCYPIAASAWSNAGLPPPTQTSCNANQAPSYCLDLSNPSCPPYPVQVTRVVPISNDGDNLVAELNAQMIEIIRQQASADSVWQHYRLIGTLWSGSPVDDNALEASPPLTPLAQAGLRPVIEATPLYSTIMETYVQLGALTGSNCNQDDSGECTKVSRANTSKSCQTCHAFAAIADADVTLPDGHTVPSFASDYSFIFEGAKSATQNVEGE